MVDVAKQIEYWMRGSEEDFAAAQSLFEKGHFRHSLFFAHLAIEKMLKAHVARQTEEIPPRIHNLIRLAGIAKLKLKPKKDEFLRDFNLYQLEGRYPDTQQASIDKALARHELLRAKEMLAWLKKRL